MYPAMLHSGSLCPDAYHSSPAPRFPLPSPPHSALHVYLGPRFHSPSVSWLLPNSAASAPPQPPPYSLNVTRPSSWVPSIHAPVQPKSPPHPATPSACVAVPASPTWTPPQDPAMAPRGHPEAGRGPQPQLSAACSRPLSLPCPSPRSRSPRLWPTMQKHYSAQFAKSARSPTEHCCLDPELGHGKGKCGG